MGGKKEGQSLEFGERLDFIYFYLRLNIFLFSFSDCNVLITNSYWFSFYLSGLKLKNKKKETKLRVFCHIRF